MRRMAAVVGTVLAVGAGFLWGERQPESRSGDVAAGEEIIHRRPGRDESGEPTFANPMIAGRLKLRVLDDRTGEPTPCRVNVIGPEGDYYEPDENPLAAFSLKRAGNREGKGPFRYYGWFFYSTGESLIDVPPGEVTVEVWKGYEYRPVTKVVEVRRARETELTLRLKRERDMAASGWYSGDPHIHLRRSGAVDDERTLALMQAEDVRFAQILCFNRNKNYSPVMERQLTPQMNGFGVESIRKAGDYAIMSGQEYRGSAFGHILHLGARRIVDADGALTNTDNWPPFGLVADEVHGLGGISIHAHGGYEKEIYADFPQEATDGVELLQFAVYRGIGLEGWYHILNAGYDFPAIGASDYPYCRVLADCRTYVKLDGGHPTFADWNRGLAAGRSFFTTGPLLSLKVNGREPGEETLRLPPGRQTLRVAVEVASFVAPVEEVELIIGGEVVARKTLDESGPPVAMDWDREIAVDSSSWVAVRAHAAGTGGRENVEAHTNPVYVALGEEPRVSRESVAWLLKKLDQRIAFHRGRTFAQREKVLAYFLRSREMLVKRLESIER